ncbi:MAG TPA: heme peroxidase family protein [Pyrinomonadaceae bacterium]
MRRHYDREVYFMVGEAPIVGPSFSGCPLHPSTPASNPLAAGQPAVNEKRDFKFGRMFDKLSAGSRRTAEEQQAEALALVELGAAMNQQDVNLKDDDSSIPSGYTYLGQFIAHEITFDQTNVKENFPTATIDDIKAIEQGRSPSIDLDALYGLGPEDKESRKSYEADGVRLKVGDTLPSDGYGQILQNDLRRSLANDESLGQALIPDPRNDENLLVAQTHVALIKFHNKVVEKIQEQERGLSASKLFERAQECVIKHFQWIVLHDFLPRIIDEAKLNDAINAESAIFSDAKEMFMPVEFSGAAFRFGHSMVRNSYELNMLHNSDGSGKVSIKEFFELTNFSGGHKAALENQWVVDWRHFYDFGGVEEVAGNPKLNLAKRIDTAFNLNIEGLSNYPHPQDKSYRPLPVRNLIRGHALGLPSGQAVADYMLRSGHAVKLITKEILLDSPHAAVLSKHGFAERTPLWYYILKEAEQNGGSRLGDVGSFIVAQTFAGILRNSVISILRDKDWRPSLPAHQPGDFAMIDLLKVADVIDPIGQHERLIGGSRRSR